MKHVYPATPLPARAFRMRRMDRLVFLALSFLVVTVPPCLAQQQWTRDANNPVMSGGTGWDRHVFSPAVLFNADSARFEMWYGATSGFSANFGRPYSIGFAYSADGVTWTRHPSPVLEAEPGAWDSSTVEGQTVIRENGTYKMWYSGDDEPGTVYGIGYATSPDGIHWTRHAGNPVIATGGAGDWEATVVHYPTVLPLQGGGYQMWYGGLSGDRSQFATGYAVSEDGVVWSKADSLNPVLSPGPAGSWDDWVACIGWGTVVIDSTGYHAWYSGARDLRVTDYPRWIGYAWSSDGMEWTKYDDPATTSPFGQHSDPVLRPGVGDDWDGLIVEGPSVVLVDDVFHMWYSGKVGSGRWRIGHATMPRTSVAVEESPALPGRYVLDQNYPNPFNPSTTISYLLPGVTDVRLMVHDVLGRPVRSLVSGTQGPGDHDVSFDASGLPSGTYLYRLQAGDFVQTRRMVVVR